MAVPNRRAFVAVLSLFALPLSAQRGLTPVDSTRGRIVFDVLETSRDTMAPPFIYIAYRTEKPLSCLLPLVTRLTRGARTFTLDEWAIGNEEVCPAAVGPAAGGMALPLEDGAQVLTIRHRGIDDRYELVVTPERIRIRALVPPRVSVTLNSTVLLRYPRNTFVITCGAEGQPWVCDGLFRVVALEAGIVAVRMPRDGRNPFYMRSSFYDGSGDARFVLTDAMMAATRVFRYRTLRDLDHVRTSMRHYRGEATGGRNGITMAGRTWSGISW